MLVRTGFRMVAAGCLLTAAVLGVGPTAAQTQPGGEVTAPPRIEFEKDVIDLGEVIRGEVVVASFVIRNVGGETLRILKAKPG